MQQILRKNFAANSPKEIPSSYREEAVIFLETIRELLLENKLDEVVEVTRVALRKYPYFRCFTKRIYVTLMNDVDYGGDAANEIVKIDQATTAKIRTIGVDRFGLPPIVEINWMLGRVGEMLDQTALSYHSTKLGLLNQKPVLAVPPSTRISNLAFIPYLYDAFDVITDPKLCKYFQHMSKFCPFNPYTYSYGSTAGHNGTFLNAAYDDLIAKEIPISPFKLKNSTIVSALEFLAQYGLSSNDEFIVLHLREEGYYDSYQHKYRNVNIENYNESIDWLLKQGLKVVRIGHPKMTPLEPRHGFIDLTISERPGEVDIYLCAKAKFYYGSSSGPYSISFNFNVPSLLTSLILYGPQRPNNLIQFLPLKNKVTGKILSIKEIKEKHLNSIFSARVFDRLGLEPIFPSSESNLLLVKEMIEYLDKGKIYKENVANRKKLRSYDILGGLCSESLSFLT